MEKLPYHIKNIELIESNFYGAHRIPTLDENGVPYKCIVLTGKNGSGKTSALLSIHNDLYRNVGIQVKQIESNIEAYNRSIQLNKNNAHISVEQRDQQIVNLNRAIQQQKDALKNLRSQPLSNVNYNVTGSVGDAVRRGELLYTYIAPQRTRDFQVVQGPKAISTNQILHNQFSKLSNMLPQYLVNRWSDKAFLAADGKVEKASEIESWFTELTEHFRYIFEDNAFDLEFLLGQYQFLFDFSDRGSVPIEQLPDGFNSVLTIVGEILIRSEFLKRENKEPAGIVLIDEIETHLHWRLQEIILPFLMKLFPQVQFIVSTHSPAIIGSLEKGVVYDLSSSSCDLGPFTGFPLRVILESRLGVTSEYSRKAETMLADLDRLLTAYDKSSEQKEKIKKVASDLSSLSSTMQDEVKAILGRFGFLG